MLKSYYLLFAVLFWCLQFGACHAHPLDEQLVLDIEQGQLITNTEKRSDEWLAAEKRRRTRYLNSLTFTEHLGVFVTAGVKHIIPKGLDHVLFIIAMFIASASLTKLFWQVSMFTLAHSISLGFAAVGFISAPSHIVEPLIALSIIWMAVEVWLKSPHQGRRYGIIFLFGLLHGLGFASVLSAFGLPSQRFFSSIVGFNLGVEIAQVMILVALAILVRLLPLSNSTNNKIKHASVAVIIAVASYWLMERLL